MNFPLSGNSRPNAEGQENGLSSDHRVGDVGSKNDSAGTTTDFRRQKRSRMQVFRYNLRDTVKPLNLLPIAILAAGTMFAFLCEPSNLNAGIVTLVTAALCLLSVYVSFLLNQKNQQYSRSNQDRFEQLEDRAWELQESEQRYRILAEAFGDVLVLQNRHGEITYFNQAYSDLLAAANLAPASSNRLPQIITKQLAKQLESQKEQAGNKEIRIGDGSKASWFHWENVSVRDHDDGGMGTLSVARDITSFKVSQQLDAIARQKAEETSRAKSKFLAMVSHEMRTPLNGIIGMSKLLSDTRLNPAQQNYAAALTHSSENLLDLINSMLDLTMIEAGRFELKKEEFDFSQLMNNAMELLSSRAYAKGIDCGLYIDPSVPSTIEADAGRLRQIIFNLVGNAIKFTPEGGVKVHCKFRPDELLIVDVIDSGPGLSKTDAGRIFQEFERVDDNTTRNTDGAGLGLAISQALVSELGGALKLAATSPTGSIFQFQIPVRSIQSVEAENVSKLNDQSFLILTKNQMEAECLAETLKARKGQVKIFSEEIALLDTLDEAGSSDVTIFYDLSSFEMTPAKLATFKQALHDTAKLILLTLPDCKADLEKYQNIMDGWLVRPVRVESLLAVLRNSESEEAEPHVLPQSDTAPDTRDNTKTMAAKGCVLLAEDNEINALLVSAALQRNGIRVVRSSTGKSAIETFQENLNAADAASYDLILMDMHMPVMDGPEAILGIRQIEAVNQLPGIPIYALTADEQIETRERAIAAGANGYLVKPIDPDELCQLVGRHLQDEADHQSKAG
ncbi:MAG: ATP-binding protein [Salaquimonas sp.]